MFVWSHIMWHILHKNLHRLPLKQFLKIQKNTWVNIFDTVMHLSIMHGKHDTTGECDAIFWGFNFHIPSLPCIASLQHVRMFWLYHKFIHAPNDNYSLLVHNKQFSASIALHMALYKCDYYYYYYYYSNFTNRPNALTSEPINATQNTRP